MKKVLIFAGMAAIAVLGACNRENIPADETIAGEKVILTVTDAPWTDETRSAYTSGTGVKLTGTEPISLYYFKDKIYNSNIKATAASAGQYSFTMPAAAEGSTLWYGILPYSRYLASLNSAGTMAVLRLGPVQFPSADSFDPQFDWVVAKPFTVDGTSGDKSGEIVAFKRLFAPLCLTVTGLPAGSKIYTATLAFSQEPTSTQALSGLFYVKMSELYAETNIYSTEKTSMSNAISAEYGSGLEAIGSGWPVWFMVNPITIASGGTMTVTVSTGDRTYSRTVALADEKTIDCEAINRITFNVCGEGYTSRGSVTQDFANQTLGGTKVLTASDGSSISWVTTTTREFRASDDGGSFVKGGLLMNNTSFTFPTIAGKNIVGARIFAHPSSRSNAGASVILTVDGTDEYVFNLAQSTLAQSVAYKGGYIDIALPSGKSSLAGLTVSASNQQHVISAITLFTEDAALDPNDYYEQFLAGNDITINGTVYNNSSYTARSVPIDDLTIADYIKNVGTNGILFIDDSGNPGGTKDFGSDRIRSGDIVVIGRYKNSQPGITTTTGIATCGKTVLKNIRVESNYAYGMFNSSLDADDNGVTHSCDKEFIAEDCTLDYTYSGSTNKGILRDVSTNYCYKTVVLSNSIVFTKKGLLYLAESGGSMASPRRQELLKIDNCVLASDTQLWQTLTNLNVAPGLTDLDLVFTHNTVYNIGQNCLISVYTPKSVNVSYNVYHVNYNGNAGLFAVQGAEDGSMSASGSRCDYNYGYSSWTAAAKNVQYGYSAVGKAGIGVTGNVNNKSAFNSDPTPFTSVDTTTGYFPVNTTVVTNGAGASYSTKLWKTWE